MSADHREAPPLPHWIEPADFRYWARSRYWSAREAVALALGASPERLGAHNYQPSSILRDLDKDQIEKRFARRVEELDRLVEREFGPSGVRIEPARFVAWLREQHLYVPEGLADAVAEFGTPLVVHPACSGV
jgi:hypothetical protein